jgi:hypothetical protein
MTGGKRIYGSDPSPREVEIEQVCKFCGGFLTLFKCQNWSIDLNGKNARIESPRTNPLESLRAGETVYIDGREASETEVVEFLKEALEHRRPCKLYEQEFRGHSKTDHCEECGELLAREAITNPCPDCLKNEPNTILKRFDQCDKDALKTELGYPLDSKDYTVCENAGETVGEEWRDYTLELHGVIIGRYSELKVSDEHLDWLKRLGALKTSEDGQVIIPHWGLFPFTCFSHREDPDLIVKLSRMRAFYKDSALYSEMRAHPYGVRRVAIHGLEYKHTAKDLELAVKGLDLLRAARKKLRGRRRGTKKYSEQRFRKVSVAKYRKLLDEYSKDSKLPTLDDLAFAMNIARSTFIRYESDYNFTLEQIRDEAIAPK